MRTGRTKFDASEIASLALLIIILIFFSCVSGGKLLTLFNLKSILDQTIIFIIAGLGCLFVVAQGGADLSLGTTVGLSSVIGTTFATMFAAEWVVFPVAIAVGLLQGVVNGLLVAKLKVPSFMATIAFLIGMRGLMLFIIQTVSGNRYYFNESGGALQALGKDPVKYTLFVLMIAVMYLILTYTKFGNYCKAIGENESSAVNVGVPVARVKIAAFVLSSFMASIAGLFTLAKTGGTNNVMGQNLEIDVLIGIFVGGVLVTGGYGTKISKLLIGCFTVSIIKIGMVLAGWSDTNTVQVTEGAILVLILIAIAKIKAWDSKRDGKYAS